MQQHKYSQNREYGPLQIYNLLEGKIVIKELHTHLNFGIFVHENRDDAHIGQEPSGASHNILFG